MAQTYGQRPATLLGLTRRTSEWVCYVFDREVMTVGRWIDNELEAERHKKNGSPRRRLRELLQDKKRQPGRRKGMSYEALAAMPGAQVKDYTQP